MFLAGGQVLLLTQTDVEGLLSKAKPEPPLHAEALRGGETEDR